MRRIVPIPRVLLSSAGCGLLVLCATPAFAELVPILGGQAVYDTERDVTYLADFGAAAGSAYDDGPLPDDGVMTWPNAMAWVASLDVLGSSNWRLPVTVQPDSSCASSTEAATGFGCTGSELGHLYYDEFGGVQNSGIDPLDPDVALFQNLIGTNAFWSETKHDTLDLPYAYDYGIGVQGLYTEASAATPIAVHDGNLAPPQVPAMGSGGLAILALGVLGAGGWGLCRLRNGQRG